MAKFYIDLYDGDELTADKRGNRFQTFSDARLAAIRLTKALCDQELPDGEHRIFAAVVRNEAGEPVYRAALTFEGQKMGPESPKAELPRSE